jgi:hypothetical protein
VGSFLLSVNGAPVAWNGPHGASLDYIGNGEVVGDTPQLIATPHIDYLGQRHKPCFGGSRLLLILLASLEVFESGGDEPACSQPP